MKRVIEYKTSIVKNLIVFKKLRFSNQTVNLVDKVFIWKILITDSILQEYKNFKNKIINTGNSRYDFCSPQLNFFFLIKRNFYQKRKK